MGWLSRLFKKRAGAAAVGIILAGWISHATIKYNEISPQEKVAIEQLRGQVSSESALVVKALETDDYLRAKASMDKIMALMGNMVNIAPIDKEFAKDLQKLNEDMQHMELFKHEMRKKITVFSQMCAQRDMNASFGQKELDSMIRETRAFKSSLHPKLKEVFDDWLRRATSIESLETPNAQAISRRLQRMND